jgi:general secretion pathway protein C
MQLAIRPTGLATAAAILALCVGAGVWGAIVFAPSPPPAPPTAVGDSALQTDTNPVARWFGTGAGARIQVTVAGLIAAGSHGSAVLSIDGKPARAYAVGNQLADGVTLADVRGTGVLLDQGGEKVEVQATALPPVDGIRSVPMVKAR